MKHVLLFLCGVTLSIAGQPGEDELKFVSPPADAFDVSELTLESGSSIQIDFRIRREFPSTAVFRHYERSLTELGWTTCKDPDDRWGHHVEAIDGTEYLVHMNRAAWVNAEEHMLTMMQVEYLSPWPRKARDQTQPRNDLQYVTVLVFTKVANIDALSSLLSIECSRETANGSVD
jgi:hypothetical protein